MRFGIFTVLTDDSVAPDDMARLVEDHGFESLFVPEHSHIPVNGRTAFPMGGEVPRHHKHVLDPFVTLTAAALATRDLRVGSGICLLTEHEPIGLAKAVASLDHLSNGRLVFGIGAGWNRDEIRHHGIDPAERMAVLRERVEALRIIWTEDEAAYAGDHVFFDHIWSWPKPKQRPHPPMLLGGNHPRVLERVLDLGVGWLPNIGRLTTDELTSMVHDLRQQAHAAGRPQPDVSGFRAVPTPEAIDNYERLNLDRCIFAVEATDRDTLISQLEQLARIITSRN